MQRSCGYFQQPQKPCLSRNKPSCCICSLPHQKRFAVNLWAGTVNNFMIWSSLLHPRLSAHIYRVFLEEILPKLLEEIPLTLRRNMWFQHDGTSDHSSRHVWEHLTATYNDRWIGWGRTVIWSPRSPDPTPLVFFLWGYMKPWFTHRQLILKRISLPVSLTQQQTSGRVIAFLHANENISYVCRKAVTVTTWQLRLYFGYNFCSEFFNT